MIPSSYNRVIIARDALRYNYNLLKSRAGHAAFLAMVKADGYGHGMIEVATVLEECGCTTFGVAELREAILLRQAGIKAEIFSMLGFAKDDGYLICQYNITPVVFDLQSLQILSQAAVNHNKEIGVHIKIDSGMSRLGIMVDEMAEFVSKIQQLPGIFLSGVASHLPSSDEVQSPVTSRCFEIFNSCKKYVETTSSIRLHIANSGATLYFPETHCDMVRCGISLYGYCPDGVESGEAGNLKPVMSFKTRVLQVKELPAGRGVSYNHTYITKRKTLLAVLPVGYEDGYSRQLTNCQEVLIRGKRAPIRGRICMNLCMVDVTDIDGVTAGDEVVLLGKQGDERITADEIASKIGTISYEVLCMIGNNNEREFV